ncbi:MAG: hypothetical protein K5899_04210 [Bacteroidaceae bacterium]|nr:hypothetical protein [Bacteroidaceae bacterium]
MRKIRFLLVALFALIGVRAFAALPEADQKGFLYNLGSGQFITADATLGETGVEFTIEIKEKDANATPSVEGAKFMRFKTGSNYLTFYTEPVAMSTYYGQLIVKSTEKGLLITHPYPNDQGPSWITAGSYLQVVDGALACTALDEANKGAYWFFGTEEELAEYLKQQQGGDQAIMNAAVKAAYDAALASYNANPNEETEAALVKAKKAATASIIAYKGVRSSIEMHKQLLSGDDVEDFMDAVADIIAELDAGTLEGSGIAEMAEIAGIYAELTADEGASEIAIFPYSTDCTVGENYAPGDNHGIAIDWDEIAAELGVEKDALKIYAMMPDGTLDETYGRGSAGTDGWRDAEGNWASWNSADNLFYVQFTGLNLDGVGCMRTAEPTSYTALFKIVNAANTEGNYVVLSITLNVNEKVISPFTEFSQLQVAETKTQTVNVGEKPSYVAAVDVDADMASILAALGVSSINDVQIFAVQSDGTLDEAYKLGSSDGWRNAAGDWAQWGDATSQFYVKSDFSREAGQLYEIGCHPEHSGAHLQGGVQYIAKFAFVVGNSEENKAVVLNVAVQSEGEPIAPDAPKASQLATDGETIQYLYNVDAKAFIVGANDWGTRVSINQKEGHQFKVQVNADGTTYTLNDWVARDNIWSSMDCQGPDNIWVDGKGRAGDGMFTIAFNEDGSFKIASNNVAGFLSVLPSKNDTKVYMSEDPEAQSTWIAVSEADYAAYTQAVKDYQDALDEYKKSHYQVGDDIASIAPATWDGQTGTYGSRVERYITSSQAAGDVLTQTLTGLKNGTYEVTLNASASFTSGRGFETPTGEGLAVVFANDAEEGLEVIDRAAVSEFAPIVLTAIVTDGTLKYGIKNIQDGGNWHVASVVSIIYVSEETIIQSDDMPKATALDVTGATKQYFFNVEAKGFIIGGNDYNTRASINPAEGYLMNFEANGDTYKLCATNTINNNKANDLDYDGSGNIWVDGSGRAGAGQWTFNVNADGTFTISNTSAPGFLSIVSDENTRLYISEAADAKSTWIAVSEEDYQVYSKKAKIIAEAATLENIKSLIESTNFYTQDAYDKYYQMYADAIAKNEAGEVVGNLDNPYTVHGWRAANSFDDFLLSAWTYNGTQCSDFATSLYINTWSTEADGKQNASPIHVPFYEYWTGDDKSLGKATLEGTVTGLTPGNYAVTAPVRVRIKDNGGDSAYGITFSANGSEPVDVCNGRTCGDGEQFRWTIALVNNVIVGADGILKVAFNIAEDNNISWLSYKDVKYLRAMTPIVVTQEATAISEVEATSAAKTIFNAAGQRINTLQKGLNIVNGKKVLVK